MSNDLVLSNEFAVSRTSKAGKTTYRGILGVITSGNATERSKLACEAIATMVENNNFKHLMREVTRVFPVSAIKKAANVRYEKATASEPEALHFVSKMSDGILQLELYNDVNPNKATAHAYATAVLSATVGKELKGEKRLYALALGAMLEAEAERLSFEAEEVAA